MKPNKPDILKIISQYFNLKAKVITYQGLCPFHKGITHSFEVYSESQTFRCSVCGAEGDVKKFIMAYENVDKKTALKILASK